MATLFVKPYQLRKLIEVRSGQESLEDALEAVETVVNNQLPSDCPKCAASGLINGQTTECDNCYGWGRTTTLTTVQTTYSPLQPVPTPTINPQ